MFGTKYTPFENLIYHSVKQDGRFTTFMDDIQRDFDRLEQEEGSVLVWEVPSGLPTAVIVRHVKKILPERIKLTIKPNHIDSEINELHLYDPRPAQIYKYGA